MVDKERCVHCGMEKTPARMRNHIKLMHPEHHKPREIKGRQEWCSICSGWFAYAMRVRHYTNKHNFTNIEDIPKAALAETREGTRPQHKRRKIGKKHKLHKIATESTDAGDDSGVDVTEEASTESTTPSNTRTGTRAIVRKPLDSAHQLCQDYQELCKRGTERLREQVRHQAEMLSESDTDEHSTTRLAKDLNIYTEIVDDLTEAQAITMDEYFQLLDDEVSRQKEHQYKVVVCTLPEARRIMDRSTPHLPIVIPNHLQEMTSIHEPGGFLDYLGVYKLIDVHFFDEATEDGNGMELDGWRAPKQVEVDDAVSAFKSDSVFPVNLLNLEAFTDKHELSAFTHGMRQWTILHGLRANNQTCGKRQKYFLRDLSNCAEFSICGRHGVMSLPHLDQAGFTTIVGMHDGEKQWLEAGYLTEAELVEWAESDLEAPTGTKFFNLALPKGYVLIQPPNRVHAPGTTEDALGQGIMLWDSRNMVEILRSLLMTRKHPDLTNEPDEARETKRMLKKVKELWEKGSQLWPWGRKSELVKYRTLLREYLDRQDDAE